MSPMAYVGIGPGGRERNKINYLAGFDVHLNILS